MTKDHVLVARHENEISGTTDVGDHPEFAARKATKVIDGLSFTGWFTEDFTLAELKTLRARERLPQLRPQNRAYDGHFEIPTFAEILALAATTRKRVGVYPEIKHGTYFDGLGMNMEKPLLAALTKAGYTKATDPVFIQSFEVGNLQRLRKLTKLRLVQLIDGSGHPADRPDLLSTSMVTPAGLADVARYADAVGVTKTLIVPRDATGRSLPPTTLVADAHKAGLKVHVWTFRAENFFLPAELRNGEGPATHGDLGTELRQFYALGIDGAFSDFPAVAVQARDK
jgi:glycerophosphoryl diester phosphodiesterase